MNLHGFFKKPFRASCKSGDAITKDDLLKTERAIAVALTGFESRITTLIASALTQMENRLMSAISEFSTRVKTAFEGIGKSVDGIVADVDGLKKKIDELLNSEIVTPEAKAELTAIADQADAIATKLAALDAATETPPTPPV